MNRYEFVQRLQGLDVPAAKRMLVIERERPIKERLQDIVDYHARHSPLYKQLLQGRSAGVFEELPIVTKHDLQKPLETIISDEFKIKDLYIGNTSGSSGHPFFYAKNKDAHARVHAIIERLYAEHGLDVCDMQARFYGIPMKGYSRYVEQLKDLLLNRKRFSIFDLSDAALAGFVNEFKKNDYIYIYGYTSAIVLFSKYLLRQGLALQGVCPSLKRCIVTSEVCTKEDRSIIERAMGVKVINEYGCSEAGMVAFEDSGGIWRLVEDDSYFEVVDDSGTVLPEGQEGRLLITNLSNKALPFIRYEVGDVGVISHDSKGRYLQKLTGRVSDVIHLPSGKVAGGLTFYYVSRSIMEDRSFIKEFIVRQTAIDTFEFDIVSDSPLNENIISELSKKMDEYLEPGLTLKLNRVDSIKRPASGKIKHFYSEIEC